MRVMCKPGSVGDLGGQPPRSTRPEDPVEKILNRSDLCAKELADQKPYEEISPPVLSKKKLLVLLVLMSVPSLKIPPPSVAEL